MEDKVIYLRKNQPLEGMDLHQIIDFLGVKIKVISAQLRISEPTLRDRLVNVGNLTMKDVSLLADFINVPREQLIKTIYSQFDSISITED